MNYITSIVEEMNRIGMIIDISHTSDVTMRETLKHTKAPVIFSHSNARALRDVPRNVPDDVLLKLKQNGGVIMITFVCNFVSSIRPVTLNMVSLDLFI
jgi:membrane dipeptidase